MDVRSSHLPPHATAGRYPQFGCEALLDLKSLLRCATFPDTAVVLQPRHRSLLSPGDADAKIIESQGCRVDGNAREPGSEVGPGFEVAQVDKRPQQCALNCVFGILMPSCYAMYWSESVAKPVECSLLAASTALPSFSLAVMRLDRESVGRHGPQSCGPTRLSPAP